MITRDYSLKPSTIQRDRSTFNMHTLDEVGLRKIGRGRLFVVDDKQRVYFIVDSQVLDYANQLVGVVSEFERGNRETFAVSPDFFSNNLRFTLDPQSRDMEVYEENGGSFRLNFKYKAFKEAIRIFYQGMLKDFLHYYPELSDNIAFQRLVSQ